MGQGIIQPPAFQRPSGNLTLTNQQDNLNNGTETLVLLDLISFIPSDGIEDAVAHRITPGVAGVYTISGCVKFQNCIADKKYRTTIKRSGVALRYEESHSSIADNLTVFCFIPNIHLSAIHFLELYATSFSGDNTVDVGTLYSFLAVQRVR